MNHLLFHLQPRSAFATLLKGDTLFGQLCWTLRELYSEERLCEWLKGYTAGQPFIVVSDAFPSGHWPRPTLPAKMLDKDKLDAADADRKQARKRTWLPCDLFNDTPLDQWLYKMDDIAFQKEQAQGHNSIDRASGTTGTGGFAPYSVSQYWYREDCELDCHILYDAQRIDAEALGEAMTEMGAYGFGKDASSGVGKFTAHHHEAHCLPNQPGADAWLTLAPLAPQGQGFDRERCWYRPFTRFGRHGAQQALLGQPFKNPLLLADTAAVFAPPAGTFEARSFIGQGLGGVDQRLSASQPETVHQGYAPVLGIRLPPAAPASVDAAPADNAEAAAP